MRSLLLSIVLAAATVALPVRANLLTNPGFETGDLSGWTVGGVNGGSGVGIDGTLIPGTTSPFEDAVVNVRSGSFAGFGAIANSNGEYLTLGQNLLLEEGSYSAGFFMGNDSGSELGIDDAISDARLAIIVDGAVVPFSIRFPENNFPTGSTPTDMYQFGVDFDVAAGPHLIEYRISGSGTSRAGFSVDDLYLNVVPEPSALTLVGVALAGLGFSRRRKLH